MANDKGKGLEGVVAARTSISDIDGQQGKLYYAGYDIADLAAHATFEETIYLLHHLELPTAAQLEEAVAALQRARWAGGDAGEARAAVRAAFRDGPRWREDAHAEAPLLPPLYPGRAPPA